MGNGRPLNLKKVDLSFKVQKSKYFMSLRLLGMLHDFLVAILILMTRDPKSTQGSMQLVSTQHYSYIYFHTHSYHPYTLLYMKVYDFND